ncbi:hypothetical protein [Actinomadura sp. 6K520]|jgi:sRNA-binding protein|uniref:hypothetical protein n=1 Tax=Actinomadura sp. 6K520 TaxID=2530364 RepID=UPI00105362DA|nr:hypothetical protein [Actinomadura sp. 6K520]TDE30868.1 hypothetical protein E1289_17935 [Actinomadura sp. 6K520]
MPRKPEISTTQLVASAIATAAAAFGASTLGVYGTIIGAALMSVISTAGSAVGQHYLDQGRNQLKEMTHMQAAVRRRDAAEDAAEEARSADPTRTVAWPGDPNATRFDPAGGDPNATRLDPGAGGDPNATRVDPAEAVAGSLAAEAGEDAVRQVARRSAWGSTVEWAKAHWVKLAVTSAAVFALVLGGITIYEAAAGEPIGRGGGGLTVTEVLGGGGQQQDGPSQNPTDGPAEPGATPGETPTGEAPATEPGTPPDEGQTGQPTGQPTQAPTSGPTTSVPADPDTPAPTGAPDGGQDGGQDRGQSPGAGDLQGE